MKIRHVSSETNREAKLPDQAKWKLSNPLKKVIVDSSISGAAAQGGNNDSAASRTRAPSQ
jgi:hypothetical protein